MPGINILYSLDKPIDKKALENISQSIKSPENFKHKILFEDENLFISFSAHENYPLFTFEHNELYFFLEGKIYGLSEAELKAELTELSEIILNSDSDIPIKNRLEKTDGEFILVIYNRTDKKLIILNDALGRLPLYYAEESNKFIISRNLKFVSNCIKSQEYDSIGIAQFLFFGYPLGTKTYIKEISRISGGSLITNDDEDKKLHTKNLIEFNLEIKHDDSFEKCLDVTTRLFIEASGKRIERGFETVLLLSGGLDSRAVGASLLKVPADFRTATFNTKGSEADVVVAEKLAQLLKKDWQLFPIGKLKGKNYLDLFRLKNGMDYMGDAFLIPFFEDIVNAYGKNIIVFTGDGGDKVLPGLKPPVKINSIDDLVDFIIENKGTSKFGDVLKITGLPRQEFLREMKQVLLSYPEKDFNSKFVHFLIFERGFKFLFEAEDRNRGYFRSETPFYSVPLFIYAMGINDEFKKDYKLYKNFLIRLMPEIAGINNAFWKFPITSYKFKIIMYLKNRVFPLMPIRLKLFIKNHLHKIEKKSEHNSTKMKLFKKQLSSPKIKEVLNTDYFNTINEISEIELNYLFTITTFIEEFSTGKNILEKETDTVL